MGSSQLIIMGHFQFRKHALHSDIFKPLIIANIDIKDNMEEKNTSTKFSNF